MADYKRQTARKCRIGHLTSGNYIKKEGWDPNVVETMVGDVSRVNLMAVVVAKEEGSLVLDDGTDRISLRSFGELHLGGFGVGDMVLVIGRPRIYNDQMYVAAEIVKKLENPKWLEYRKKEISRLPTREVKRIVKESPVEVKEETISRPSAETKAAASSAEEALEKIRKLDKGDGAGMEEVGNEKLLKKLLEEGEIFEIRPGKVKVLE